MAMSTSSLFGRALAWLQIPLTAMIPPTHTLQCTPDAIPHPSIFGADILNLSAEKVFNYSSTASVDPLETASGIDFCNVTVTYTHPGTNDNINVWVWLPLQDWNGRFMGVGGGGWTTGHPDHVPWLNPALELNYASASTDGGHGEETWSAASWAQTSPGNVDWNLLHDFADKSLDDLALIGKAVTKSFYGRGPEYSYWQGCSTGGRQGLMLAQRYPGRFDGILAAAPAVNWATFVVSEFWPQQVMDRLGEYPETCEMEAFTAAAIEACDGLDGVKDGIISTSLCSFDPYTLIGKPFQCEDTPKTFTKTGAMVAEAAWKGPKDEHENFIWHGLGYDAPLTSLANTSTTTNGTRKGEPFAVADDWIRLFVFKDPDFDTSTMTDTEYLLAMSNSIKQFESIMSTNSPDLGSFRDAGGKMITWHGLADELIPPNNTKAYFDRVLEKDPRARDYYRYFQAPGVEHCKGGTGPFPGAALDALVRWVEGGEKPEVIEARDVRGDGNGGRVRGLCAYPKVQRYRGGDVKAKESFECV